jgi:hypothetical protein
MFCGVTLLCVILISFGPFLAVVSDSRQNIYHGLL